MENHIPKSRLDMLRQQMQTYVKETAVNPFTWERGSSGGGERNRDECVPFSSRLKSLPTPEKFSLEDLEFFDALGIEVK